MSNLEDDILALVAIGGPLTVSQLAEALRADPDDVMAACDDLLQRDRMTDGTHGLVSAGSLPNVSNARRALLAERVTTVLDRVPVEPERLGRLYLAAGRADQAFPLLEEAATAPSIDNERAIELLTLAIESVPRVVSPSTIGRLYLRRARRRRDTGLTNPALADASEAISYLTGEELVDALALASVLADDRQLAQESERWAAMALLEAGRLEAHPKSASLLTLHARGLARLGFAREAGREQVLGLGLAATTRNELQEFYTRLNAARVQLDAGDVRAAIPSYERLRDMAARLEGPVSIADKDAHLARAQLLAGEVKSGLASIDRSRQIANDTGAIAVDFLADIALVEGLLAFHRYREGLEVAERIVQTAETSLPAWRNRAAGYRASALIGLERVDDADAVIRQGLAETPSGADGLRLRLWLRCREMAAGDGWDRRAAENLTDLLLQSGWLQTAAEFLVMRADRERHPELAAEAAALAYRLGQPMLAADALEVGRLWSSRSAGAIANRLRAVEATLPDSWREDWTTLPAVTSGLAVDVRDDGHTADTLRRQFEAAMGSLDSADTLSPAQRITSGAVRRRKTVRTVARTVAQAVGVALVTVIVVAVYFANSSGTSDSPELLATIVDPPSGGLSGSAPLAGGDTRSGVFEGSVREPNGIYWRSTYGGFFEASPVVFGNSLFLGNSEGRLYSIDLTRGTTTFEATVPSRIDQAAAVFAIPDFGESGQSKNLVFFGSEDGSLTARALGDTGERVWTFETGGPISGPPIVIGSTVVVASADGHVYAIDGRSGSELRRFPERPIEGGFTEPLAADDSYLYAVGGGDLHMFDLDSFEVHCTVDLAAGTRVVTHPVVGDGAVFVGTSIRTIAVFGPGNCGGAPTGLSPSHQVGVDVHHAPVVDDGVLWVAADELVLALDAVTGALEVIDVGGVITSPIILAADSLVIATEGGRLVSIDTASRAVEWEVDFGSEIRAPVAVVNDVAVVVTTRGDLYALSVG